MVSPKVQQVNNSLYPNKLEKITVEVNYVDLNGTAEKMTSTAAPIVGNVNDDPIGKPEILGDLLQQGKMLTANTSTIADEDGMGTGEFSYQWLADGQIISEATNYNFTLNQDEVGKVISVRVSYTDAQGTFETVTSDATAEIGNVNDTPVGVPEVFGDAVKFGTLQVDTSCSGCRRSWTFHL